MANTDCASILKRGYLVDKKAGLLDRRRWYVLRQDLNQGYCVLEFYKDEKAASKRDNPKGFINIADVVNVHRQADKKHILEILCPGVAYRLMASSEADAEDWTETLSTLILYRRGDVKSLSLPRSFVPVAMSPVRPAMSVSSTLPSLISPIVVPTHAFMPNPTAPTSFCHTHATSATMTYPDSQQQPHFQHAGQIVPPPSQTPLFFSPQQIHPSYPTPPESIVGMQQTCSVPVPPVPFQKQTSTDSTHPYPSPPSSSDSSSMCSGSNTSFDSASVMDADSTDLANRTRFRVQVKGSERMNINGFCDLQVTEDVISIFSLQTGQQLVAWPIGSLRRYGVNNVCFTIEAGRFCDTGEGKFFFYSPQSRMIHSRVHFAAQRLNAVKENRRASAPDSIMSRPVMSLTHLHTHPNQQLGSSPPQYNHIQHTLTPSSSQEPYQHLSRVSSLGPSSEYSKLEHGRGSSNHCIVPGECSTLDPSLADKFSSAQSFVVPSPSVEEDAEDQLIPPVVPPRLTKMTSI